MARTMMEIPFAGERQTVETAVRGVLVADKYKEIDYNGDAAAVWMGADRRGVRRRQGARPDRRGGRDPEKVREKDDGKDPRCHFVRRR